MKLLESMLGPGFYSTVAFFALRLVTLFWSPVRRLLVRLRIRRASGLRIAVLVAKLEDDTPANSIRQVVIETIERELKESIHIIRWSEALYLQDGNHVESEAAARRRAIAWLKDKRCDILIWGRIKSSNVVALRFSLSDQADATRENYALSGEYFELPTRFISDLGSAIATCVLTSMKIATAEARQYLVPAMKLAAERLRPLAASPNPQFDRATRGALMHCYALARGTIGIQENSVSDLREAVEFYEKALGERTRDRSLSEWATSQNNLGNALCRLGELTGERILIERAIRLYEEVQRVRTRERFPLLWAGTQSNIGNAFVLLGQRKTNFSPLLQAIAAYRDALQEQTRERDPLNWAITTINLAHAIYVKGTRELGTSDLIEATELYGGALEIRTRDKSPLEWADAKNNLGISLLALGDRQGDLNYFHQAIFSLRDSLRAYDRNHLPGKWAATQINLANALTFIGGHDFQSGETREGITLLERAVSTLRESIDEFTKKGATAMRAKAQFNLGRALCKLGEIQDNPTQLMQGIDVFRNNLEAHSADSWPIEWASTKNELGVALTRLGDLKGAESHRQAVRALRSALTVFTFANFPFSWVRVQANLADALRRLGKEERNLSLFKESEAVFRETLSLLDRGTNRIMWASASCNLAAVLLDIDEHDGTISHAQEAIELSYDALDAFREASGGPFVKIANENLTRAEELSAYASVSS
jgi:tetratricopeptide (TPR) repeat protein